MLTVLYRFLIVHARNRLFAIVYHAGLWTRCTLTAHAVSASAARIYVAKKVATDNGYYALLLVLRLALVTDSADEH
jgi:hypothetical protein